MYPDDERPFQAYDHEAEGIRADFECGIDDGKEKGEKEGFEKGLRDGRTKEKLIVAEEMKKQGYSLEQISNIVKMSLEELTTLERGDKLMINLDSCDYGEEILKQEREIAVENKCYEIANEMRKNGFSLGQISTILKMSVDDLTALLLKKKILEFPKNGDVPIDYLKDEEGPILLDNDITQDLRIERKLAALEKGMEIATNLFKREYSVKFVYKTTGLPLNILAQLKVNLVMQHII